MMLTGAFAYRRSADIQRMYHLKLKELIFPSHDWCASRYKAEHDERYIMNTEYKSLFRLTSNGYPGLRINWFQFFSIIDIVETGFLWTVNVLLQHISTTGLDTRPTRSLRTEL